MSQERLPLETALQSDRRPVKPRHSARRFNAGEEAFLFQCLKIGLWTPERNYRFHPIRRWEIDFAWPDRKIGIEIQGGVWNQGKHGRGSGIVKDMEKHNALMELNWRVWLFTPKQVKSGEAIKYMEKVILS